MKTTTKSRGLTTSEPEFETREGVKQLSGLVNRTRCQTEQIVDLSIAEQQRLQLANLFGIDRDRIMRILIQDRKDGKMSVFERTGPPANDSYYALAA